jgi:hypothetical protein
MFPAFPTFTTQLPGTWSCSGNANEPAQIEPSFAGHECATFEIPPNLYLCTTKDGRLSSSKLHASAVVEDIALAPGELRLWFDWNLFWDLEFSSAGLRER